MNFYLGCIQMVLSEKDGVVKTHTCWNVPIYGRELGGRIVQTLIEKYYRPYHQQLTRFAEDVILGIDCHTMAAKGPPVGLDSGITRPHLCLSDYGGTCPREWTLSLAANTILNLLKPDKVLMLAEGLNVFRVGVNASLLSKSLAESRIRLQTGCNVIATSQDGKMVINPDPSVCLLENNELIVIGTDEAEKRFFKMYSEGDKRKSS